MNARDVCVVTGAHPVLLYNTKQGNVKVVTERPNGIPQSDAKTFLQDFLESKRHTKKSDLFEVKTDDSQRIFISCKVYLNGKVKEFNICSMFNQLANTL